MNHHFDYKLLILIKTIPLKEPSSYNRPLQNLNFKFYFGFHFSLNSPFPEKFVILRIRKCAGNKSSVIEDSVDFTRFYSKEHVVCTNVAFMFSENLPRTYLLFTPYYQVWKIGKRKMLY